MYKKKKNLKMMHRNANDYFCFD